MKNKRWFLQYIQFTVVGTMGALVQLSILYFLTDLLSIYYLISASISFVIAASLAFTLNRTWTFKIMGEKFVLKKRHQYPIYISSGAILFVFNLVFLSFLVEYFEIYYILAQFLTIILFGTFNFLTQKKITFKNINLSNKFFYINNSRIAC